MTQSTSPSPLKILIVDDELNIRKTVSMALESQGHSVLAVSNARDAIDEAARQSFDLALVDLRLGDSLGLDLIPQLRAQSPWLRVVVITAHAAVDTAVETMRRGAVDYLAKPFNPDQVREIVARVAEARAMDQRSAALHGGGDDGQSRHRARKP